MNIIPKTRRSLWKVKGNDVEIVSTITCVSHTIVHVPGLRTAYRSFFTVEVEFGTKVARVRSIPNDEALEWEERLVLMVFVELGALEVQR